MPLIRVLAYSTSANLGPGFDILAMAHDAYYDIVDILINPSGRGEIKIVSIEGRYGGDIPLKSNTGYRAAEIFLERYRVKADIKLRIYKGIPVGMGLGSSGATAVAVLKGLRKGLDIDVDIYELVEIAGYAEAEVAGTPHFDNVAAGLLGHLVLIYSLNPLKIIRLNVNSKFILVVPFIDMPKPKTMVMREVIPGSIPLNLAIENMGKALILLYGLISNEQRYICEGMCNPYIDELRSGYIDGFNEIKRRLRRVGVESIVLSGAGPSFIIPYGGPTQYKSVVNEVSRFYRSRDIDVEVKVVGTSPGSKILRII